MSEQETSMRIPGDEHAALELRTAGQRCATEYLLSRGADLNWEPDYAPGTPLDAASGLSTRQENVISWLRELGASAPEPESEDHGSARRARG